MNRLEKGALYLVGTPIGNLSDMSPRASEVLAGVDFIAAEDTRNTLKLLTHFGIQKPMVSYFEHNIRQRGQEITQRLLSGENAALVSDAGMPAISDPGEDIVRLCAELKIPVYAVPGPTAFTCALVLSGFSTSRFTFEGFLSVNKRSRRLHLESLKQERRTMIFYEAPHKLRTTLEDFKEMFGPERRIALCRELTKIYEEVIRTDIEGAIARFTETAPKGEFVLVVEGAPEQKPCEADDRAILSCVEDFKDNGMTGMEAVKAAAKRFAVPKSQVYRLVSAEKNKQ